MQAMSITKTNGMTSTVTLFVNITAFMFLLFYSERLGVICSETVFHGYLGGTGTHSGDTGASSVMFGQDIVHHGNGAIFVGNGSSMGGDGKKDLNGVLSVDDIHDKMGKAIMDKHRANLDKQAAMLSQQRIAENMAQENEDAKNDELKLLNSLDRQAKILEKEKPEVLGKKTVPVVHFTEETNPLKHHMRMMARRIDDIKATEEFNIEAQKSLTRLDDITDKFRGNNILKTSPKLYNDFISAGKGPKYTLDVPVTDPSGSFYIAPHAGVGSHSGHEKIADDKQFMDDHRHSNSHDLKTVKGTANPQTYGVKFNPSDLYGGGFANSRLFGGGYNPTGFYNSPELYSYGDIYGNDLAFKPSGFDNFFDYKH